MVSKDFGILATANIYCEFLDIIRNIATVLFFVLVIISCISCDIASDIRTRNSFSSYVKDKRDANVLLVLVGSTPDVVLSNTTNRYFSSSDLVSKKGLFIFDGDVGCYDLRLAEKKFGRLVSYTDIAKRLRIFLNSVFKDVAIAYGDKNDALAEFDYRIVLDIVNISYGTVNLGYRDPDRKECIWTFFYPSVTIKVRIDDIEDPNKVVNVSEYSTASIRAELIRRGNNLTPTPVFPDDLQNSILGAVVSHPGYKKFLDYLSANPDKK